MMVAGRPAKILLIDSNVYFSKRLGDALRKEGFEVISANQAAFALTTLEYDAPVAILCATNMREMGALEIANVVHADPKAANAPCWNLFRPGATTILTGTARPPQLPRM
jgi:CheY-like chemotaxis protein